MAKRPGVSREKLNTIIRSTKGLTVSDKKLWTRIQGGNSHFRMYIQRAETVRQVDLTNFGRDLPGTVPLTKENGRVQAHLDLSDETQALKSFERFLGMLNTMEVPEKPVKVVAKKPTKKPSKKTVTKVEVKKAA